MRTAFRRLGIRIWPHLPGWCQRLAIILGTPKVTPGACAIVHDTTGRLLLARHTYRRQPWSLPGGFVRHGEEPPEALARELREELDVASFIGPVVHVEICRTSGQLTAYYRAEIIGTPRPDGVEIDECRFVSMTEARQLLGTHIPSWLGWCEEPAAA